MRAERGKLSRHADVAKAMDYMLKRWDTFSRFLGDGRICLTNNAAERALRGIALGRSPGCPPAATAAGSDIAGGAFSSTAAKRGTGRVEAALHRLTICRRQV